VPAALGLMAPVAADMAGSANASKLNLDGVNDYIAFLEACRALCRGQSVVFESP